MTAQLIPLRVAEIGNGTPIRRALPHRQVRRIGAWCFLDHAGPVRFSTEGLDVAPHPHVGLQTFTWMIEGELLHRDSLGFEQLIRPNQVNLMTAGYGITHSETTPPEVKVFHSAQLWIALPKEKRHMAPSFEHFPQLPQKSMHGVTVTVLMGQYLDMVSPVPSHTPLVGVDIKANSNQALDLVLRSDFEYGILVLSGRAQVGDFMLEPDHLYFQPRGQTALTIKLDANTHILFLGGEPYTDPLALWWNFVVHDQKELEQAYNDWVHHAARFGEVLSYPGPRLEAPDFTGSVRFS